MLRLRSFAASGFVEPAPACEGTEVVFEDKFTDDAGGWAINKDVEVKDGASPSSFRPTTMQSNLNVTFTVEGCRYLFRDGVAERRAGMLGAGLLFWGEDNRNYFQFGILNNGKFWIARKQDGKWLAPSSRTSIRRAIKMEPGAANMLRVKTNGNSATFYINGTKVRDLRGQAPKGGMALRAVGRQFRQGRKTPGWYSKA